MIAISLDRYMKSYLLFISEQIVPYVTFLYEYLGMFVWFLPGLQIKKII